MERKEMNLKHFCFKDKGSKSYLVEEETETDMVEDEEVGLEEKKKRGMWRRGSSSFGGGTNGGSQSLCQVENCGADLAQAKQYHRRHKVCEVHAKSPVATVAGLRQRFCQQCSRFHELSEFDEAKRSCRSRLAGHNERRRKSSTENSSEGSSRKGVTAQFIQTHDRNRVHMRVPTSSSFKRSQII